MLTSNLWTHVGLHNGARGKVIDFVYMNSDGTLSQTLPEAVVVQFSHLEPDMTAFLEYYPGSVAIPTITAEWKKPSGNGVFTRTQLPLNLSWEFTIHKSQRKTLERIVIDLGAGDKFSGLTLVALSRVRMFKHFLLKPLTFEGLHKVNTSSGLVDIKNDLYPLKRKAFATILQYQTVFQDQCNLSFTLFHRRNFHLFKKSALSNQNSGWLCLLCYYYYQQHNHLIHFTTSTK